MQLPQKRRKRAAATAVVTAANAVMVSVAVVKAVTVVIARDVVAVRAAKDVRVAKAVIAATPTAKVATAIGIPLRRPVHGKAVRVGTAAKVVKAVATAATATTAASSRIKALTPLVLLRAETLKAVATAARPKTQAAIRHRASRVRARTVVAKVAVNRARPARLAATSAARSALSPIQRPMATTLQQQR